MIDIWLSVCIFNHDDLQHLRVEENPILKMSRLEAAAILLVGPTLKKFNDRGMSNSYVQLTFGACCLFLLLSWVDIQYATILKILKIVLMGIFPLPLLSRSTCRRFIGIVPTCYSGSSKFLKSISKLFQRLYSLQFTSSNSCRSFSWGDINCQALSFTHCLVHSRWLGTMPPGTSCWYETIHACFLFLTNGFNMGIRQQSLYGLSFAILTL